MPAPNVFSFTAIAASVSVSGKTYASTSDPYLTNQQQDGSTTQAAVWFEPNTFAFYAFSESFGDLTHGYLPYRL